MADAATNYVTLNSVDFSCLNKTGPQPLVFQPQLTSTSTGAVTVDYATKDGVKVTTTSQVATAPKDYSATSGKLTSVKAVTQPEQPPQLGGVLAGHLLPADQVTAPHPGEVAAGATRLPSLRPSRSLRRGSPSLAQPHWVCAGHNKGAVPA